MYVSGVPSILLHSILLDVPTPEVQDVDVLFMDVVLSLLSLMGIPAVGWMWVFSRCSVVSQWVLLPLELLDDRAD